MANDLVVIERDLDNDYMPMLANILAQTPSLPAISFKSAFMETISQSRDLLDCTRQSLFACAASFSFIGLLPGSFTGQAYMLPFRDNKAGVRVAVPVIGYKGYNTVAQRGGVFIEGYCIRKEDDYKINVGTGKVHHEQNLLHSDAQIIGAWSRLARGDHHYSLVSMGIKQLMAVKAKSKGSRKTDSPWNDEIGPGFEAMCEKTVRRRQARSLALNPFLMADSMETLHDLGTPSWVIPSERDGSPVLMTPGGETKPPPIPKEEKQVVMPPKNLKFTVHLGPQKSKDCKDIGEWMTIMLRLIRDVSKVGKKALEKCQKAHGSIFHALAEAGFDGEVQEVIDAFNQAIG